MRLAWPCLLAVGCDGRPSIVDALDEAVDFAGVDVIVTQDQTRAYLGFPSDRPGPRFAPLDSECTNGETDAIAILPTCFENMRLGGRVMSGAADHLGAANYFRGDVVTADTTLEITACGRVVEVPVRLRPLPDVEQLWVSEDGTDILVAWSSPAAASALVGLGGGFTLETCHRTTNEERFVGWAGSSEIPVDLFVHAIAFAPPDVFETEVGPIRVWFGSEKATTFRSPQSSAK